MEEIKQSLSSNIFFRKIALYKLRTVLLTIVLIVGSFLIYIQIVSLIEQSTLQKGYNAFAQGDFDKTIQIYEQILEDKPNNIDILTGLVEAYAGRGDISGTETEAFNAAQPYVKTLLSIVTDDRDALLAIGYLVETDGRYQEASDYYQSALKIDPNFAQTWFRLGHVNEFLNSPTFFVKDLYNKAYELDPNNPLILLAQGNIALANGDIEAAYAFFSSVGSNSNYPTIQAEGWTNASKIKSAQGFFDEAKTLASLAVNSDRNYAPGLIAYGMNLSIEGDHQQALDFISEAMNKNSRISKADYSLAVIFRVLERFDDSINYFQKALLKIDKDNTILGDATKNRVRAQTIYDLAKTHSMSGNTTPVIPLLEQAIGLDENLSVFLESDFESHGFFRGFASNQEFLTLINTQ